MHALGGPPQPHPGAAKHLGWGMYCRIVDGMGMVGWEWVGRGYRYDLISAPQPTLCGARHNFAVDLNGLLQPVKKKAARFTHRTGRQILHRRPIQFIKENSG